MGLLSTLLFRSPARRLAAAGVAAALLLPLVLTAPVAAWSGFNGPAEAQLLAATNADRAAAGLPALLSDSYLQGKAQWRAQDMGDRNYFSHQIPPANDLVFAAMQSDGYCFSLAGENIGLSTYGDDVATAKIEVAFMDSPEHRANILGSWSRIGVGAYEAADGRKLYAVLFSVPCAPAATPSPILAPSPKPVPASTPKPTPAPVPSPSASPTMLPAALATWSYEMANLWRFLLSLFG